MNKMNLIASFFLVTAIGLFSFPIFAQTGDSLIDRELLSRQRDMEQLRAKGQERRWVADAKREEAQNQIMNNIVIGLGVVTLASTTYGITKRKSKKDKNSTLIGQDSNILDK